MEKEVSGVIDALLKYHEPQGILLFGSSARGDRNAYSDLDICVLYDRLPARSLVVLQALYRALYDVAVGPVDLVVYEASDFSRKAARSNSFEARIKAEGVLLYGAA